MSRRHHTQKNPRFGKPKDDRYPVKKSSGTEAHCVYGSHAVQELINAKRRKIHEILIAKDHSLFGFVTAQGIKVTTCDKRDIDALVPDAVHQGIYARTEPYPYVGLDEILGSNDSSSPRLLIALDSISDPQNFATLCRSALAFGVSGIIIPQDRSVAVTAAVCKASAGTIEHLKVARVVNLARALDECKEAAFWVYGADAHEATLLTSCDPAKKSVIVMGAEGDGMRRLIAEKCDMKVKIPMTTKAESLNVAQAGTVMCYEFARKLKLI